MYLQQIRNATIFLYYGGKTFLIDSSKRKLASTNHQSNDRLKIFQINLSKPIFYSSFTEIKYRLLLFQPAIQMDLLDFLFQFIKK